MRVRFTVRTVGPDEGDVGPFAVWDGSVHGWRAKNLADEPAATRAAAELELRYDVHGPRKPDSVRAFGEEPRMVQIKTVSWSEPVELHAWLKADGEWYGVVRDAKGRMTYVRGGELRPAEA